MKTQDWIDIEVDLSCAPEAVQEVLTRKAEIAGCTIEDILNNMLYASLKKLEKNYEY